MKGLDRGNIGLFNSGYRNSGDRNSGVFCNKKIEDTVPFFNKDSNMTWYDWYHSDVYDISLNLKITEWIDWDDMTNEEKKENPKAFVCGGYLEVHSYKDAWKNLWETLSDKEKSYFKTLPNFDSDVFEDITGIRIE